jgi:hypothetical protein
MDVDTDTPMVADMDMAMDSYFMEMDV